MSAAVTADLATLLRRLEAFEEIFDAMTAALKAADKMAALPLSRPLTEHFHLTGRYQSLRAKTPRSTGGGT